MFRNLFKWLIAGVLICLPELVLAQETDTSKVVDTLPPDTVGVMDTIKVTDTLTDRIELLRQFEERYQTEEGP